SLALRISVTSGSTDLHATSASRALPYPSLMSSPPCSAANDTVPEANTTGATAAAPSSPAKAIAPSRRSPEPRCIPPQGAIKLQRRSMTAGISLIPGKTGAHRAPLQFARSQFFRSESQPQLQLDYEGRARRNDATKVDAAHVG